MPAWAGTADKMLNVRKMVSVMTESKWRIFKADNTPVTWCGFCGTKVGSVSEVTQQTVTAMYYCEQCWKNYCDQCSVTNNK